jgi:hypothetical protein
MNTDITKQIMERFYQALDELIATKTIRGVNTYCRLYDIDRRNLQAQRKDLNRGWFQVSWLQPMVREFGVSARWLLTGYGKMFDREK